MIFYPKELQNLRLAYLIYKTIVNTKRFLILNIIEEHQPINVTDISIKTKLSQAIVSQNLAMLRKAKLIENKKDKKNIYYSSSPKMIYKILEASSLLINKPITSEVLSENYSTIQQTAQKLKILNNPSRLLLLEVIKKNNGQTQQELIESTNMVQSVISQNLKILLDLGIIEKKQMTKYNKFYIHNNNIDKIKNTIENLL